MAEEQKWQEPGGHRLCANNCGFFGSPTTLNLCSKCYKDYCLKERRASEAKLAVEKTLAQRPPSSSSLSSFTSSASLNSVSSDPGAPHPEFSVEGRNRVAEGAGAGAAAAATTAAAPAPPAVAPNRCAACRKRVGMTGFTCRCGTTFCGTHRYPEQHGCTFDYKAMGREEIARSNPVVVAEKLEKI